MAAAAIVWVFIGANRRRDDSSRVWLFALKCRPLIRACVSLPLFGFLLFFSGFDSHYHRVGCLSGWVGSRSGPIRWAATVAACTHQRGGGITLARSHTVSSKWGLPLPGTVYFGGIQQQFTLHCTLQLIIIDTATAKVWLEEGFGACGMTTCWWYVCGQSHYATACGIVLNGSVRLLVFMVQGLLFPGMEAWGEHAGEDDRGVWV